MAEHHSIDRPCPIELAWLADQLDAMDSPAKRAALIGALHSAAAGCLLLQGPGGAHHDAEGLPPLSHEQRSMLAYLRDRGIATAEELAHHAGYSVSTVKGWCGPGGDLRAHGIISTPRGYSLAPK